jgi:hypothetical protein
MRTRTTTPEMDLNALVDVNCQPDLPPERQAEARKALIGLFGPYADAMLRACDQAAAAVRQQRAAEAELARLARGVQLRGIVTGVHNGRVRVALGGGERELVRPDGIDLGLGQTVLTDTSGGVVLAVGDFVVGGQTYVLCERLEARYALVRAAREGPHEDARQLALVSDAVDLDALAAGDRVLGWSLDGGNLVLVTRRLGPLRSPVAPDVGVGRAVTRADIVGLDDVLEEMELIFMAGVGPAFEPLLVRANRALVGAVFHGAPGTGKSMVAEYFVEQVRARGGRALYRTAGHYLSRWVGDGPAALRADFATLDAAFAETGVRPLLIVDELEAIALDRLHRGAMHAGYLEVLDELLGLLTRTDARMIGISNVGDRYLDQGLVRSGRLHLVPFPATLGPEGVAAVVSKCLAGVSLAREEV